MCVDETCEHCGLVVTTPYWTHALARGADGRRTWHPSRLAARARYPSSGGSLDSLDSRAGSHTHVPAQLDAALPKAGSSAAPSGSCHGRSAELSLSTLAGEELRSEGTE